ncbi:uncharacterized protein CDV56_107305 [Aspergillus thermomutatus]|uniref:NADP-dependent oxidoreductase domain-containing protein n=1 Tax=Aspergillus thermomutatus TaxID=41047 RepID=A0A397GUA1_ASPTH|nr:uncharacterized protein CDV56_107305 [Aspergillus thermomutatus]RHZ53124.1 hypothetical protein CDV56_107305 [Aspergillus thermomutatus]
MHPIKLDLRYEASGVYDLYWMPWTNHPSSVPLLLSLSRNRRIDISTSPQDNPSKADDKKLEKKTDQSFRDHTPMLILGGKHWNNCSHNYSESAPQTTNLLYLVHFPVAFKPGDEYFPLIKDSPIPDGDVEIDDTISIVDTWKAMTKLPKSKARAVGVSNHTVDHLEALIKATGVVPAANQIERHPRLQSNELIAYCKEKGIHVTAYSAFGNNMLGLPLLIASDKVKEVAAEVSKRLGQEVSPAQVILAWSQVGGHSVIPKSVTPSRIAANFQEIELTPEEVEKPRWDINIFGEEDEKPATHKVIV